MDVVKKVRSAHRTAFTKTLNELNTLLSTEQPDKDDVLVTYELLEEKMTELNESSQRVINFILDSDAENGEALFNTESSSNDEYKKRFLTVKRKVSNLYKNPEIDASANSTRLVDRPTVIMAQQDRKKLKLPTIEISKFSGSVRDWLHFWNQFRKIHEDNQIDNEDKFHYLLQSMESGSRAHDLILSFPQTRENYTKAVEALKKRYGKDELQVEVYVRELLCLVLNNAVSGKDKLTLASLHDKLLAHMSALETLGVTSDKCAAMLFPLVESAIPEDVLRAWQRSLAPEGAEDSKQRLTRLMAFLSAEVDAEERINMATMGFTMQGDSGKSKRVNKQKAAYNSDVPTAVGLLAQTEKVAECIFCGNSSHTSTECNKAKKLPLEERRTVAKGANCCMNCLRRGHYFKQCKAKLKCPWCGKRHVLLMCFEHSKREGPVEKAENDVLKPKSEEINLASFIDKPYVLLQTLNIKMVNGKEECIVRALIDTGSQRSYITSHVAKKMNYVSIDSCELSHALFGGVKSTPQNHNIYPIHLRSLVSDYACNFKVMDQKVICENLKSIKSDSCLKELQSHNITLSDNGVNEGAIDLLIGADIAGKLMTGKQRDLKCGLTAIETHFGWTVMGKDVSVNPKDDSILLLNMLAIEEANISNLWRLDVLGIQDPVKASTKQERQSGIEKRFMESTFLNKEGRYEVKLPWIPDQVPVSSNEVLALKRLDSTIEKLKRSQLLEKYDEIFAEWEREGIIERVPPSEMSNFAHYLPHRAVIKMSSTSTKIRPVFDASAREKNFPSLNDCLETGANLIELICSIFLKFRRKELGVTADIKRAFLQMCVAAEDRDFLRFWWRRNGVLIAFRHKRVVFGVTSSSFLLAAKIKLHLNNVINNIINVSASKSTIQELLECFYSDNCVTSVNNERELQVFMDEATRVLRAAGFELTKWEHTGDKGLIETTVLGIIWNKQSDTLSVNLSFLKDFKCEPLTKRVMLSAAQHVFDPIGFTCPALLYPKLLLQQIWKENLNWDEELNAEMKKKFLKWLNDLNNLSLAKIPRKLGMINNYSNVSFHAFADASCQAYAAAVFLRIENEGNVEVQLVRANARVAPSKRTTIPRMELLAAVITARLADSIIKAMKLDNYKVVYWTDSTTVLSWINREAQWSTFVWNRVQEIRRLTDGSVWRHVPGAHNPADLPSRGCSPSQLAASKWWEGPSWLRAAPQHWPTEELIVSEEEVNSEAKKSALKSVVLLNETCLNVSDEYLRYFSTYSKIIKMLAWIYRFKENSRIKEREKRIVCNYLTGREIEAAENLFLRVIQKEMFVDEQNAKLKSLNVFKDEYGLLRLKSKVFYRDDSDNFRCPILLDPAHDIVTLIIREEHNKLGHAGVQTVLCSLREKFWIFSARRKIRSVLLKCVRCKRYEAKHLESISVPLPVQRVRDASVFEIVGVDLAGPLFLKGGQRAYVCIFTCAVYRAVHFELLSSLSTVAFLKGFSRFVARRGRPSDVFSDNGTNFVGAESSFDRLNWELIAKNVTIKRIEWHFNPPSAAWWGGWWERIVRLLKHLLRRVLAKAQVNNEDMYTILCDCEAVINARPLTYLSSDCNDLIAITPNLFLQEIREVGVPDLDNVAEIDLRERSRYCQKLKNDLRRRFRLEYFGQLRENVKSKEKRELHVGDLVLVGNDDQKRINWPLGRVISAYVGRDGNVRVYRIKTQNGELTRPIQRLFPLEIDQPVEKRAQDCANSVATEKLLEIRDKVQLPPLGEKTINKINNVNAPRVSSKYVTRFGRAVVENPKYKS